MNSYNKCDLCALKVIFDQNSIEQTRGIEDFFSSLRALQEKSIIRKGYSRIAYIHNRGKGDKSEMCAVNSVFFLEENKDKECPYFLLHMNLSIAEALSLHVANETEKVESSMERLTHDIKKMTRYILYLTIIAVALAFISAYKSISKSDTTSSHTEQLRQPKHGQ